jgi:hypothetical protein
MLAGFKPRHGRLRRAHALCYIPLRQARLNTSPDERGNQLSPLNRFSRLTGRYWLCLVNGIWAGVFHQRLVSPNPGALASLYPLGMRLYITIISGVI